MSGETFSTSAVSLTQVFTRDRKYGAYVLCVPLLDKEDPERCAHRAYFEDYYTGAEATIYEIRGEPDLEEVTRPIDSLKRGNNYTLSCERWEGPHFGHRYMLDAWKYEKHTQTT